MSREDERNTLIINKFIAAIVSTGKTRKEAITMIDSQGLTVTDMESSLHQLSEVLELGTRFMQLERKPVSDRDLYLYSQLSDAVASNPEIVRKPGGGSPDRKG